MPQMWGVFRMGMKTIIEDPQGWLVAACVMFFILIMLSSISVLIISTAGYNVGNLMFWMSSLSGGFSFIIGLLMGGNLRESAT